MILVYTLAFFSLFSPTDAGLCFFAELLPITYYCHFTLAILLVYRELL